MLTTENISVLGFLKTLDSKMFNGNIEISISKTMISIAMLVPKRKGKFHGSVHVFDLSRVRTVDYYKEYPFKGERGRKMYLTGAALTTLGALNEIVGIKMTASDHKKYDVDGKPCDSYTANLVISNPLYSGKLIFEKVVTDEEVDELP